LTRLLGVGGVYAVAQGAAAMGVGVGGHEVLAVQVDAVSITKGNVGSLGKLRPVTAYHVDTEAQDDKDRERGIEVEVRTGNHRADDQQDDRRQELQVPSPILAWGARPSLMVAGRVNKYTRWHGRRYDRSNWRRLPRLPRPVQIRVLVGH